MMKNSVKPFLFLLCACGFAQAANAQNEVESKGITGSQDTTNTRRTFKKEEDFASELSKSMRSWRRKTSSAGYMVSLGSAARFQDTTSEAAVDAYYLSYKEALVDGYANLIIAELRVKSGTSFGSKSEGGQGSMRSNQEECLKEYEMKTGKLKKAVSEEQNSLSTKAANLLGSIFSDDSEEESDPDPKKTMAEQDLEDHLSNAIIYCEAVQDAKSLFAKLDKSAQGGLAGVRVFETLSDGKQVGVVLGRNSNSARDAGILKAQNMVAKPLADALFEAEDLSVSMVEEYMEVNGMPPYGLIGVLPKKLSNGEMAYIGFGAAYQKEAVDYLDSENNQLNIDTAYAKALGALNEFAYMTVNSSFSANIDAVVKKVVTEFVDAANRGEVVDIQESLKSELKSVMTKNMSAESEGFLNNPQLLDVSAYSGGDSFPDFYLASYVWSPSIMTNARNTHNDIERANQSGKRGSNDSRASGNQGAVKRTVINSDW